MSVDSIHTCNGTNLIKKSILIKKKKIIEEDKINRLFKYAQSSVLNHHTIKSYSATKIKQKYSKLWVIFIYNEDLTAIA